MTEAFLAPPPPAGPDFFLAPWAPGLLPRDGIRPGYQLERVLGETFTPQAQSAAELDRQRSCAR